MDEQKFFAWLDGELESAEAAKVAAEVSADPELSRKAEEHRSFGNSLRAAFDPVMEAEASFEAFAPARGDSVASLAEARVARAQRRTPTFWQQAAAMAATFLVGIATGTMLLSPADSPVAPEAGRLVASASLEQALYSRLASAPADEGPRIGLTFRDKTGSVCRTFTDQAANGLACYENGDWRMRALFQAPEGQTTDYRMAAGGDPNLMAVVDETIAGEPFDAAQERAVMERGWR